MFYEVMPKGRVEALAYSYNDSLAVGQIVLVPLGKRQVPGVVLKKIAQPDFPTKPITKILYSRPLPSHLIRTAKFMHEYYLIPAGQLVSLLLPEGVEKKRRKTEQMFGQDGFPKVTSGKPRPKLAGQTPAEAPEASATCRPPDAVRHSQILLNQAQKNALQAIQNAPGATKLLFGVTGSGKTNIYLKMALDALEAHKSVILLVPEIALTSQLVRVFRGALGEEITLLHSRQTEAERHRNFERLLLDDAPRVVIGPRSALFAPLDNLGLIIIDEEHDGAYYQENSPKYSAIRVASYMANALGSNVILGSATPAVEDYHLAKERGTLVELSYKAKKTAQKPDITVVDLKERANFRKNRYFCDTMLKSISTNLASGQQTLIFHNRRGSAPLTICEHCGEELVCPHCYLPLTLHADSYELVCHTCGLHQTVPSVCPKCGQAELLHKGFGTKLLESEMTKLFPEARIRRFDADNKKSEALGELYAAVHEGEVDILIGTQTLAKGLDLPRLATVGIVQADAGLSLPDYMAEERTFQTLTQVIGRVGRGHLGRAEVIIQTFRPEHPVVKFAAEEDYSGFASYLLDRRQRGHFPPYRHLMRLELDMKTERLVVERMRALAKKLQQDSRLMVSPPAPAFHERTTRGRTWQIIVRARARHTLTELAGQLDKNIRVTLDPPGLL